MAENDGMNSLGINNPKNIEQEFLNREAMKAGVTPVQVNLGIGTSGTQIYAGYYDEEYLDDLKHSEAAHKFDEMRRKDSQVQMLVSAVKLPIMSGLFEFRPYDDSPEAEDHAKFLEIVFREMEQTQSQMKNEILDMVIFGHSAMERIHKVYNEPVEVEGRTILPSYIGLKELRWISPKTIETWNFKDKEFVGITQYAYGDVEHTGPIPKEVLSIFTINKEGQNHQGISLLRPCYGCYFRKQTYQKLNAIGIEKFAIGIPIGTIPLGAENSTSRVALEKALSDFCTHQSNYIVKTEGFDVDVKFNSYDPQKIEVAIDNEDKRMAKAFLASFLELGLTTGGSQALSSDLSTFFKNSLEYIIDIIESEFNKTIIPELIKLNFPDSKKFPHLYISGVTDTGGLDMAQILTGLTSSRILVPDKELEEYIRKLYALPEKGEEPNKPEVQSPFMETAVKAFRDKVRAQVADDDERIVPDDEKRPTAKKDKRINIDDKISQCVIHYISKGWEKDKAIAACRKSKGNLDETI